MTCRVVADTGLPGRWSTAEAPNGGSVGRFPYIAPIGQAASAVPESTGHPPVNVFIKTTCTYAGLKLQFVAIFPCSYYWPSDNSPAVVDPKARKRCRGLHYTQGTGARTCKGKRLSYLRFGSLGKLKKVRKVVVAHGLPGVDFVRHHFFSTFLKVALLLQAARGRRSVVEPAAPLCSDRKGAEEAIQHLLRVNVGV